jgi:SAM-dependent methyltransferase
MTVDYEAIYESPEYMTTQVHSLANETNFQRFAEHPTYKPFFDEVPKTNAATLLDVGCGVGCFAQAADRFGWRVTGADISETAVQIGRRYASFPLLRASLEELSSRTERYDVVTAFEVLEHQAAPLSYLKKMKDLATENGHVFCTVPNWECESVQSATRPDWIPPVHLCFFTSRALQRLGELAGFAAVKTGIIWTQGKAKQPSGVTRWFRRRNDRTSREALGLWLMGRRHAENC